MIQAAAASVAASIRSISGESAGICRTALKDAVAALLAGFGSSVAEETVAVLETDPPGVATRAVIVTVAVAALTRVPSEQVTVAVPLQVPWDGVALTNVIPAGRVSVTVTPVAVAGPPLATVIV